MKNPSLTRAVKQMKVRNPRVGHRSHRPATHTVGTSFRDLERADVLTIQQWYRSGYFTQREIAELFDIGIGVVSKCCRCVKKAGDVDFVVTPKKNNETVAARPTKQAGSRRSA